LKRKPFGVFLHAIKMVGRNIRSYAMLSVTIILSLSVLLGFMGYMDTMHYNRNKTLFARDRSFLRVSSIGLNASSANRLQEKAEEIGTTHTLQYIKYNGAHINTTQWTMSTGEKVNGLNATVYAVPRECWYLEQNKNMKQTGATIQEPYQTNWLDGRDDENITLEKGQILMDEQLFQAFGLSKENCVIELSLLNNGTVSGTFVVVGTVPSNGPLELEPVVNEITDEVYMEPVDTEYRSTLVFSLDDLNPQNFGSGCHRTILFYSDQPENVKTLIKTLEPDLTVTSIYELQNTTLEKIRTEKGTKAIVAALLVLILGINLYSSFENALNDRKFEIGVKRAMGASGFSIIRQFFYESMIVMFADIAISVALVVNIGIVLKYFKEAQIALEGTSDAKAYILYITPYSVGMFAACAIVLTVVFSFVFAYKTTQVQIVDYLKAE